MAQAFPAWRIRALDRERPASAVAETAGLPAPALLLLAGLAAAAAAQGGYHTVGQVALAVFLGAALVTSVVERGWDAQDLRAVPVPAAAALAAWAIFSGARAGEARAALSVVGLLAGVAAVVIVCRHLARPERQLLVGGAVAVGAVVALSGWAGVAFRISPWALESSGLWRAATTLTYANAAAGLLVPLALVALAGLAEMGPASRGGGMKPSLLGIGACLLVLAAVATISRFGILTLALGCAGLCALLGPRRFLRGAAAPIAGAAVGLVGLLPSIPGGHPARPLLAGAGLLAGVAIAAWAPGVAHRPHQRPGRPHRIAALAGVTVAVGAAIGVGVALLGPSLHAISAARLTLASPARTQSTQAALRLAAAHPLTGVGPGNAGLSWAGPGSSLWFSRYAHDEYLQVLAELGAVGAGLLAVLLVSAGSQVARGRQWAPSPALWAGAVVALGAFGLHSGADFLWHLPVLPLMAALLIGITAPPRTTAPGSSRSPSTKEA